MTFKNKQFEIEATVTREYKFIVKAKTKKGAELKAVHILGHDTDHPVLVDAEKGGGLKITVNKIK